MKPTQIARDWQLAASEGMLACARRIRDAVATASADELPLLTAAAGLLHRLMLSPDQARELELLIASSEGDRLASERVTTDRLSALQAEHARLAQQLRQLSADASELAVLEARQQALLLEERELTRVNSALRGQAKTLQAEEEAQ